MDSHSPWSSMGNKGYLEPQNPQKPLGRGYDHIEDCHHCKIDKGPAYLRMSLRHVPNFVRNLHITIMKHQPNVWVSLKEKISGCLMLFHFYVSLTKKPLWKGTCKAFQLEREDIHCQNAAQVATMISHLHYIALRASQFVQDFVIDMNETSLRCVIWEVIKTLVIQFMQKYYAVIQLFKSYRKPGRIN